MFLSLFFPSWSMLFNTINSSWYFSTFLSFYMFWSSLIFHLHESVILSRLAWGWLLAPCERSGGSIATGLSWFFLNYLHSFWITWHVMAHGLVMIFSGPSEAFFAWNHPSPTDSLDILDPLRIASWQAMAASVQTVNAKHLQALEDCMNVLLSHPIFDPVQSMPPQAIDSAAEQNEAGSQAGLACDLSCLSSLIWVIACDLSW